MSWEKHARVLAPKELATRIGDEGNAIAKLYAVERNCAARKPTVLIRQ